MPCLLLSVSVWVVHVHARVLEQTTAGVDDAAAIEALVEKPETVEALVHEVARREKLTLPPELAGRVAAHAERNMRRALLSLEACRVQTYPFKADQPVAGADWEAYVTQIANEALAEQSPKRLLQIRDRCHWISSKRAPAGRLGLTTCSSARGASRRT